MRVSHECYAVFADPNLVSRAGLAPVLMLAESAGAARVLDECLTLKGPGSANKAAKMTSLVAGMIVGADSIDGMDLLRLARWTGCSAGSAPVPSRRSVTEHTRR